MAAVTSWGRGAVMSGRRADREQLSSVTDTPGRRRGGGEDLPRGLFRSAPSHLHLQFGPNMVSGDFHGGGGWGAQVSRKETQTGGVGLPRDHADVRPVPENPDDPTPGGGLTPPHCEGQGWGDAVRCHDEQTPVTTS